MKNGFSLIEMIIAVFLSMMVLVGIIEVSTSMIRQHFESMSQGELSGDTLIGLNQMNTDIENASSLVEPNSTYNSSSGDAIAGCTNWSLLLKYGMAGTYGILNNAQPVSSFYYCAAPATGSAYTLWRYSCSACPPPSGVSSCNGGAVSGCSVSAVVYNAMYEEPGYGSFFYQIVGGVAVHYLIGNPSPTTAQPNPISYRVDNVIMMRKSYGDTDD